MIKEKKKDKTNKQLMITKYIGKPIQLNANKDENNNNENGL